MIQVEPSLNFKTHPNPNASSILHKHKHETRSNFTQTEIPTTQIDQIQQINETRNIHQQNQNIPKFPSKQYRNQAINTNVIRFSQHGTQTNFPDRNAAILNLTQDRLKVAIQQIADDEEIKKNLEIEISKLKTQIQQVVQDKNNLDTNYKRKFEEIGKLLKTEKVKFEQAQKELNEDKNKVKQERELINLMKSRLDTEKKELEIKIEDFHQRQQQHNQQELSLEEEVALNKQKLLDNAGLSHNHTAHISLDSITSSEAERNLQIDHELSKITEGTTTVEPSEEVVPIQHSDPPTDLVETQPEKSPVQRKSSKDKPKSSIPGFNYIADISYFYNLQQDVGDGNFALVWRSEDIQTGELAAVKHIEKRKVQGKYAMLQDEVAIMNECDHQNIVTLFCALESKKSFYLCMEFVQGGDLFDLITEKVKFSEREAAWMMHDLAEALSYLHNKNIVHRDIKPENLLCERVAPDEIGEFGPGKVMRFKLADFGLAVKTKGKRDLTTVCGKYLMVELRSGFWKLRYSV